MVLTFEQYVTSCTCPHRLTKGFSLYTSFHWFSFMQTRIEIPYVTYRFPFSVWSIIASTVLSTSPLRNHERVCHFLPSIYFSLPSIETFPFFWIEKGDLTYRRCIDNNTLPKPWTNTSAGTAGHLVEILSQVLILFAFLRSLFRPHLSFHLTLFFVFVFF